MVDSQQWVYQASRKTWHDAKRESAFKVLPALLPQSIYKNGEKVFRPTTRILEVIHLTYNLNELLTVWLPALATLLLLLTLVGVFTWRWRRRSKQDKHQIRGRNGSRTTDMIYSQPEDPVKYSSINDEIPHDPKEDIIYSIIDNVPGSEVMKPPAGGAIYSIIYSTVGPH